MPSVKIFTGIISAVDVDRLSQTAEIRVVDFLDYFGRKTIEATPVWENISLTQLFKNLVGLVFPDWVEGTDYFVADLGGSTIPAIGYTDLKLLSELKNIAESRGMRLYTDVDGKLHCAARNPDRPPLTVKHDYNLTDVTERRDINSIINWVEVHARPHEIEPESGTDSPEPGKVSGFTVTPADHKITLTWENPEDDDFEGVRLCYHTSGYPPNPSSRIPLAYVDKDFSPNNERVHTGLLNGKMYYYSAFAKDSNGNYSEAAQASAIAGAEEEAGVDETAPSGIADFKAEAGWESITLTWRNPEIADFSLVKIRYSTTDYPEEVTDGINLYSGAGETRIHSGLTLDVTYYYSAFVQNTAGRWSRGVHASATPGPSGREELSSYSIQETHTALSEGKEYFSSWTYKKKFCFSLSYAEAQMYTTNWLKFKHRWNITCHADLRYADNQKQVSGEETNISLSTSGASHSCNGGVATCTLTYISSVSSGVSIWVEYKLTYTGGNIQSIVLNNTLSLIG